MPQPSPSPVAQGATPDAACRARSYSEAHKMKLKADQLEAWELERFKNDMQRKMFAKESQFRKKQKQELLALRKRIQSGRDDQKKQRQADLERCVPNPLPRSVPRPRALNPPPPPSFCARSCSLLQRYQNVKSELQAQQSLERIRVEKLQKKKLRAMQVKGRN